MVFYPGGTIRYITKEGENRMWGIAIVMCFASSMLLTPVVARMAWRIGAIDVPRDWRRMHTDSVPRTGGLAVFASFAGAVLLFCPHTAAVCTGLAGGAAVCCIGLADDVQPLSPFARLAVQTLAAIAGTAGAGIRNPIGFLGAVFWLLAVTNAHNLIDGLDGLLAGTAVLEGVGLALLLFLAGQGGNCLQSLLMASACMGFLRYNRPPARVFAGDCGSGTVGYLLGWLALPAFAAPSWRLGSLAPLFVFAYPLTDLTAAVLRRAARGRSLFSADRAHLHHRICAAGVPQPVCAAMLCGVSLALGICGVLLARETFAVPAAVACTGAALVLPGIRLLVLRFAAADKPGSGLANNSADRSRRVRALGKK